MPPRRRASDEPKRKAAAARASKAAAAPLFYVFRTGFSREGNPTHYRIEECQHPRGIDPDDLPSGVPPHFRSRKDAVDYAAAHQWGPLVE